MYKRILQVLTLSLFILFIGLFVQHCGNDVLSPSGDYIAGTVTFTDTNIVKSGGYYALSVYAFQPQPFSYIPVRNDSLNLQKSGSCYTAYYKISGLSSGDYYLAATWIRLPYSQSEHPPVLGTYGCDTSLICTHHTKVTFPNYAGTADCNFVSWTDTTKRFP